MRRLLSLLPLLLIMAAPAAMAGHAKPSPAQGPGQPRQVEITADDTLEWYEEKSIYVARRHARAVKGDMMIDADVLTAHEQKTEKSDAPKLKQEDDKGAGDIDVMTADGHVTITTPTQHVTGDHAVYDMKNHVIVVTGKHLTYVTDRETVTAKNSLEYWEDKKIAVARGNAVAVQPDRRIMGDTLTAEFQANDAGVDALWKVTAVGTVQVFTATDVTTGDTGVYDVVRNMALVKGNVRITRDDGTHLVGETGEVDFGSNQSRLLDETPVQEVPKRVRALLPQQQSKDKKEANEATP